MRTPTLFTPEGRPLALDAVVGRGGEGVVYALTGSADTVVKFYTVPNLGSREAKIKSMIATGLAKTSPLIAFPLTMVSDNAGAFAGFTMRKVSQHQALHELYAPGARKAAFPRADYRFLVRTATNISRAVAAAHHAGCVIGDINPSGILVSERATAALIDADSFQVTDGSALHLCMVGTLDYTPPELQGRRLDIPRIENHDAFGLAVVVFLLLFMGRHPFSGRYVKGDMPIEKAIAEFRFVYSQTRDVGMDAPPAAPSLKDFPSAIGAAFEAAFGPAGEKQRPTAKQWISLLSELEQNLRGCAANSLHHYPQAALECPWCRMERLQGVQLFIPLAAAFTADASARHGASSGDVVAIWRAIEAVKAPAGGPFTPTLQNLNSQPSAEAKAARRTKWRRKVFGLALLLIAIAVYVVQASFWPVWIIAGGWGLVQLLGSGDGPDSFLHKARDIELRWLLALDEWQRRADETEFTTLKASLATLKAEIEALPAEERRRILTHSQNRRAEHLNTYLEQFQIRRFKINGIGPSKRINLTSYGIETAADVSAKAVQRVPGFGPVNSKPLLEWRRQLEGRFVYNANPTQADHAATVAIKSEIARKANELCARLALGPAELTKAATAARQRRTVIDPVLQRLHEQRTQAAVDLKFLGLTLPPVQLPPKPVARPAPQPARAYRAPAPAPSPQSVRCPRCGSSMLLRTARQGRNAGQRFYGCSRYPSCRGTRPTP